MSRRDAILARAALLASSSSDDEDADVGAPQDKSQPFMRALARRPVTTPLEERSERTDAPYRPPGDRAVAPRSQKVRAAPAPAPAPRAESNAGANAEAMAKADAKLLLKSGKQPIVEQAFSLAAPAKVPRAVRQKFLNVLAAKKLRAAANVGARDDVSSEWIDAHGDKVRRAMTDAVEEEQKLLAKASSKVTYRNLSAQLLLRGGASAKPAPGATAQDYKCDAANVIDLDEARIVRGNARVFFVSACKRRLGEAHARFGVEPVVVNEETSVERTILPLQPLKVDEIDDAAPLSESLSANALQCESATLAVKNFCRNHLNTLLESKLTTTEIASIVEAKVVAKVMRKHVNARNGNFLVKEADSVMKLLAMQVKHETNLKNSKQ